jgi:hypothetical protein
MRFWERHYLNNGKVEEADRATYYWWLRFGEGPPPDYICGRYIQNPEEKE